MVDFENARLSHRPHSPVGARGIVCGRWAVASSAPPFLKFTCMRGTVPWELDPLTALCTFRTGKQDGGGGRGGPRGWRVRTPCWGGDITTPHHPAGLGPQSLIARVSSGLSVRS